MSDDQPGRGITDKAKMTSGPFKEREMTLYPHGHKCGNILLVKFWRYLDKQR
jgi:hypothetical protein